MVRQVRNRQTNEQGEEVHELWGQVLEMWEEVTEVTEVTYHSTWAEHEWDASLYEKEVADAARGCIVEKDRLALAKETFNARVERAY